MYTNLALGGDSSLHVHFTASTKVPVRFSSLSASCSKITG